MEIKLPTYLKCIAILMGLLLLIYFMQLFKAVLVPLAFAMLFALLLLPLSQNLERLKLPRALAIMFSLIVVISILGLVIWFLSAQIMSLTSELDKIGQNIDELVIKVQDFLYQKFSIPPSSRTDLIRDSFGNLREIASSLLQGTISTTTGALAMLTIIPIFIFCFLYYRDHLQQFMFKFVSKDRRSGMMQTVSNIQTVVQSYLSGLMIVIVIVSLLNSMGLLILGVKYAIFFGVFASILTIIPYIGILIGAMLPALFTLAATGNLVDALLVVGVFSFVQFLEGNFITPFIVGSKVSINPFAAIIALLLGGEIWGAAGMILSIPLIAMLKVLFDAYEPLEPFGYLLADIDDLKSQKSGRFNKMFDKLRNRAKKQGQEIQE
ncbi:AI-2E family transporter [Pontibacter arcticus]|uniref:AI-2E family transporter n=1 Tax=Pontibacter arcticus TaxID=2080288 RepID=A0A364RGM1_9BACT|nr:AI-2E family transporter [Pontibacter arcticus]RAU83423.1 AI-2E family transporter [Pontibacter arcticus]